MLFWIIFSLIAFTSLFRLSLEGLNWAWIRKHRGSVPPEFADHVDPEKVSRIEAYTQAKIVLGLLGETLSKVLVLGLLLCDGFAWLAGFVEYAGLSPLPTALAYFGIMAMAGNLLSLPFEWYANFRVEEKYGFNRLTYRIWISDLVKGWILGAVIGGILLGMVVLLLYHSGSWWWLICWVAVMLFSLLLTWIYPLWIAPLFNKFTPLADDDFRMRVEALLEKAGIRSREVLVMDAGKRSGHTNAYFTGLGRSKRVVFYDTLLEKHEPEQCLAVLAHEAGHWKHRDVLKNFVEAQALSLAVFALAGWLVGNEALYRAFGFETITPYAGLFLVSLVSGPALFFLKPLQAALSRRAEFAADRFAARMPELRPAMRELLIGLALDNLANLNPHPLYVAFHYSHPTVAQRVRRLDKEACQGDRDS